MKTEVLDDQTRAKARALFETSLMPLADIARQTGANARALGIVARKEKWPRPAATPTRQQIVGRLWQSASQNLENIEQQVREGATSNALRDLAVLTKLLRDLMALDAEAVPEVPKKTPTAAQTRAQLMQRLERMRALEV